uniref:Uncharacterized protein n=1 Tax=Clytia hemisphaerica TaxID=252671 RepID=A0A7M5UC31_9CNID
MSNFVMVIRFEQNFLQEKIKIIKMSFFGGYNNYNGRGGGFPRPRHQNARFGIAPLMRPNNQQRPRMGMSPRGGRPPFRGGNHGPNQHRFRSPGRDDSFRMRGPRPPHNMSYNRTIKPDQQPPGNTEDFTKDVDMTEIIETKPAVDTITPNISKSEVTESKQPQSAEEPKKEEVSKVEVKEEIKQEDIKPTPKMELDRYNSELHVKLSQDNLVGEILKGDGFQYMWGGVRGTHGVKRGMI